MNLKPPVSTAKAPWFETVAADRRDRGIAFVTLVAIVMAVAILYTRHPSSISGLPICPSKLLFQLECPGCGSTRAVHHLLHLRIAEAWRHNPAMLILGLPALGLLILEITTVLIRRRKHVALMSSRAGFLLAGVLLLYMIIRNVPLPMFDALRPPA